LKQEANNFFKNKQFDDACKKYQAALSTVRTNMNLKGSQAANDVEVAIRGNLSLCKLNLKLYDDVVEHCEKILDVDPKNSKANYRMAQAVWELSEGVSASQVDSAFKYAKIAAEQVKNDDKVQ
jgi:tetratricopeptide (TPR) repeat protein